jgi:hypothetical protein
MSRYQLRHEVLRAGGHEPVRVGSGEANYYNFD